MTWNIRTGVGNDPTDPDGRLPSDLDRIAAVIRDVDPDVVALQEIDRHRDRTGYVDQTSILADALGMHAVFAPNLIDDAGEYGIATLSRFPILRSQHDRFVSPDGWEPRGVLEIGVDFEGRTIVSILNTHLQIGLDDGVVDALRQRRESAEIILRRIGQLYGPAILMGDFNAEPGSPELEPLAQLTDAWAEGGEGGAGMTIPASPFTEPRSRIDVIYANARCSVEHSYVVRNAATVLASDHFPVLAEFRVRDM